MLNSANTDPKLTRIRNPASTIPNIFFFYLPYVLPLVPIASDSDKEFFDIETDLIYLQNSSFFVDLAGNGLNLQIYFKA